MHLAIGFLSLVSLASIAAVPPGLDKELRGKNGCFLLQDLSTGKSLMETDAKACAERRPACSTFKVALALIAADRGLIQSEATQFKWDGKDHGMPAWNKDQTAATWISSSVVWVSQELARKLGQKTIERYLRDFGYGTADLSGGIDTAWLTAGPLDGTRPKTTVLISPVEQARFLSRLWKGDLPVSKQAIELTRRLTFVEKSANGYELYGKTGSGFLGDSLSKKLGWFVSRVAKGDQSYIAVASFVADELPSGVRFAGLEARELTKRALSELGKY